MGINFCERTSLAKTFASEGKIWPNFPRNFHQKTIFLYFLIANVQKLRNIANYFTSKLITAKQNPLVLIKKRVVNMTSDHFLYCLAKDERVRTESVNVLGCMCISMWLCMSVSLCMCLAVCLWVSRWVSVSEMKGGAGVGEIKANQSHPLCQWFVYMFWSESTSTFFKRRKVKLTPENLGIGHL